MVTIRSTRLMERLHLAALDPWITYAAIIALALAVHKFVETPARKALTRRFSRQHAAPKPAAEFSSLSYSRR